MTIAKSATAVPMVIPGQMTKTTPRTRARTPRSAASFRVTDAARVNMRPSLGARPARSNTEGV